MANEVKASVVVKAVEKDDEHATVAPNQYCDVALIPGGAQPSKPFKDRGGWKIIIGKDAIYNPPRNEGLMGGEVKIECGARINGSVFGRSIVEIESGKSKDRGIIYGTITSLGEIRVVTPKKEYEKDKVLIIGDLIGKEVHIDAPVIVYGNIISDEDVNINAETITYGYIYSKRGCVKLKETFAYSIVAGNAEREVITEKGKQIVPPREFGLEIGETVSLLIPMIWTKNGKIKIEQEVRLIDYICQKCVSEQFGITDDNTLYTTLVSCPLFKKGRCNNYRRLTKEDIMEILSGQIITDAWRTYRESDEKYNFIFQFMKWAIDFKKDEHKYKDLFEADRWQIATTDDLRPDIKIEQRIEKMFATAEAAAAYASIEATAEIEKKKIEAVADIEKKKIEEERLKEEMRKRELRERIKLALEIQDKERERIKQEKEKKEGV